MPGNPSDRVKPLTPPPGPTPAQRPQNELLTTSPISGTGELFEMTIPYEGGSRFIQMLNRPVMTIGRRADNDIVLGERCVSGYHAKIHRLGGGEFEVEDLESYNGTFVNGERVRSRTRVKAGDILEFGRLRTVLDLTANPEVTQRLTLTVDQLSKEVSRLSMERDTCRYSLSQLQGEHEQSLQAARDAQERRREQEDILAQLEEEKATRKRELEALATEAERAKEERARLLQEAAAVRNALLQLQEEKARLQQQSGGAAVPDEIPMPQGMPRNGENPPVKSAPPRPLPPMPRTGNQAAK